MTVSDESQTSTSGDDSSDWATFVKNNYWKVRQCSDYVEEYKECTSFRGRFHQYFITGDFADCSSWRDDVRNCEKASRDAKAFASIIQHENERQEARIKAHFANDVWQKRKEPPADWNSELPDFILEKQKNSFRTYEDENKSCVIS